MLDVFVAEAPAVLAYGEAHAVAAGLVVRAGVFGIEGLDREAAFDADGHRKLGYSICCGCCANFEAAGGLLGIEMFVRGRVGGLCGLDDMS